MGSQKWHKEAAEGVRPQYKLSEKAGTKSPNVDPHQTATTSCRIAPKIEWPSASSIWIFTVSPALINGVFASPSLIVSIIRISAMQL